MEGRRKTVGPREPRSSADEERPRRLDSESALRSLAEERIQAAMARGEFNDLPGAGEPLRGLDENHDENWWVKRYCEREGLRMPLTEPPNRRTLSERDQNRVLRAQAESNVNGARQRNTRS
jgi:hypothetical protein